MTGDARDSGPARALAPNHVLLAARREAAAPTPDFAHRQVSAIRHRSPWGRFLVIMYPFVAIILICLNSVAPEGCNETTAADVLSNGVENELSCVMGWQDVVARSALARDIGRTAYVKTLCRRAGAGSAKAATPR